MSRHTFRSIQESGGVAWQKQLRDRHQHEPAPDVDLSLKTARVGPVAYDVAKQIIFKYEWLGTMGTATNRCYGLSFGPYVAGVTCWTPAGKALPALAKSFGIENHELAYLVRGACVHWAPVGTNSKLIGYSLKLEAKRGSKLAIAFSDSDAGEIGTVYQATNWTFVGKGDAWPQWVSPKGRLWSLNQQTDYARRTGMTNKQVEARLLADGWKRQTANPKGRYVFLLDPKDERLAEMVEKRRQPYPKRGEKGSPGGTTTGEGGSIPTSPLPRVTT